jgi:hypothetical protein
MEVAINHVIAIAEKSREWRSLERDSLGLGIHKNNSVLFDKKNRSHYFYIEYNKKLKQL